MGIKLAKNKNWSMSYEHETGELKELNTIEFIEFTNNSISSVYNSKGEELNTDYIKYSGERPQQWKTWEWLKSLFGEENIEKANFFQSNGYGDYIINYICEEDLDNFINKVKDNLEMQDNEWNR